MSQITTAFAEIMLATAEDGRHTPLTIWEEKQLALAWLERERMRSLDAQPGAPKKHEPHITEAALAYAQPGASGGAIGFMYADDLQQLREQGAASIYEKEQDFVLMAPQDPIPVYIAAPPQGVQEAVRAEREACAKFLEQNLYHVLAAQIRARSIQGGERDG